MTPATPPRIDVIIPAQRAGQVLAAQLQSLADQDDPPSFRVIVVVAPGPDETRDVVARFGDELDVTCVAAPVRGAALARNVGAEVTTGAVLLFCDADDRVGPRWVRFMADEVERSGLAGGPIVIDRTAAPRWVLPFYDVFEESPIQHFWGDVPYVLSASMGVRRDVFDAIGGFDAGFPGAGGEEVDLCLRAGLDIGVVTDPEAALRYTPRSTFSAVVRQRTGYARGAARVAALHGRRRVGRLHVADLPALARAVGSPRRVAVMACSFVVLHRELRRHRRLGVRRLDGSG